MLTDVKNNLATLDPFFNPRSIAVVGAGNNPRNPNGLTMLLLGLFDYKGKIYPVNPKHDEVYGEKCYVSLTEIEDDIDLAVIAVRADLVMGILKECARKNIRAVVIFTSGFAEIGGMGKEEQEKIRVFARENGIRILGPNCLGISNYYNGSMASFFYNLPQDFVFPRFFSFISQSGGVGWIIYQAMLQLGVGFNYFISTGNEADISFAEMLTYLVNREEVSIIGGYLEGLYRHGREFIEACEQAMLNKKLIAMLKVGKTSEGARAASSHTGALAGEDRVYDAVFSQKGVIRTDTIEEMSALISIYAAGKIPQGNGIGIITISGGGGVILADKCPAYGLDVVHLSEDTQQGLREYFPAFGASQNPVDLTSQIAMIPDLFQKTIKLVMDDPLVDVGVFLYNIDVPNPESNKKIIDVYRQTEKPLVIFTFPTQDAYGLEAMDELIKAGIPVLQHIPSGLQAISDLSRWSARTNEFASIHSELQSYRRAYELKEKEKVFPPGRRILTESHAKRILSAYGIPVTGEILAVTAREAIKAAENIGYPVALKVESPDIVHKSNAGGVILNLNTAAEVEKGFSQIMRRARRYKEDALIDGVLVQEMLRPGLEVIVGLKRDPIFGPMILFGLGGIFVEILEDVSMKVAPLSGKDAREMIREIKGFRVLEGVRGQPPRDLESLTEILMGLSRLALEYADDIEELDINPLIVYEEGQGAVAADALIILKEKY